MKKEMSVFNSESEKRN